jgi:hypothetical protein
VNDTPHLATKADVKTEIAGVMATVTDVKTAVADVRAEMAAAFAFSVAKFVH